jgi:hypothetical protein
MLLFRQDEARTVRPQSKPHSRLTLRRVESMYVYANTLQTKSTIQHIVRISSYCPQQSYLSQKDIFLLFSRHDMEQTW